MVRVQLLFGSCDSALVSIGATGATTAAVAVLVVVDLIAVSGRTACEFRQKSPYRQFPFKKYRHTGGSTQFSIQIKFTERKKHISIFDNFHDILTYTVKNNNKFAIATRHAIHLRPFTRSVNSATL